MPNTSGPERLHHKRNKPAPFSRAEKEFGVTGPRISALLDLPDFQVYHGLVLKMESEEEKAPNDLTALKAGILRRELLRLGFSDPEIVVANSVAAGAVQRPEPEASRSH